MYGIPDLIQQQLPNGQSQALTNNAVPVENGHPPSTTRIQNGSSVGQSNMPDFSRPPPMFDPSRPPPGSMLPPNSMMPQLPPPIMSQPPPV